MNFVNAYITAEDRAGFDFSLIKRPLNYLEPIEAYSWTVDRERAVFLVWTGSGREDEQEAQYFALWWKGVPIHLKLLLQSTGDYRSHVESTWSLAWIELDAQQAAERACILDNVRQALIVYKVRGIGVKTGTHEARFTF